MSKVNSQSQTGSASFTFPQADLLVPGVLSRSNSGREFENEGVVQPVDNQAFTKRSEVDVRAGRNSNAQGQSQITQSDFAEVDQFVVPIGVQVED